MPAWFAYSVCCYCTVPVQSTYSHPFGPCHATTKFANMLQVFPKFANTLQVFAKVAKFLRKRSKCSTFWGNLRKILFAQIANTFEVHTCWWISRKINKHKVCRDNFSPCTYDDPSTLDQMLYKLKSLRWRSDVLILHMMSNKPALSVPSKAQRLPICLALCLLGLSWLCCCGDDFPPHKPESRKKHFCSEPSKHPTHKLYCELQIFEPVRESDRKLRSESTPQQNVRGRASCSNSMRISMRILTKWSNRWEYWKVRENPSNIHRLETRETVTERTRRWGVIHRRQEVLEQGQQSQREHRETIPRHTAWADRMIERMHRQRDVHSAKCPAQTEGTIERTPRQHSVQRSKEGIINAMRTMTIVHHRPKEFREEREIASSSQIKYALRTSWRNEREIASIIHKACTQQWLTARERDCVVKTTCKAQHSPMADEMIERSHPTLLPRARAAPLALSLMQFKLVTAHHKRDLNFVQRSSRYRNKKPHLASVPAFEPSTKQETTSQRNICVGPR